MNVSLKPSWQQFIQDQVKAGRFSSETEVVEAGLARLLNDPILDELDEDDLAAIDEAEEQIARGEDKDWNEVSAELRKKYLGE